MRSFIIITVLSALAACYGTSVLNEEVPQKYTVVYDDMSPEGRILSEAETRFEDWPLLSEFHCLAPAVPNEPQHVTVRYEGKAEINRVSISYSYVPPHPDISFTPLGFNYMVVNITSHPGVQIDSVVRMHRWP